MNGPVRPVVAIVGRPNVGKSTLFNRLIRRRRAIVADEAGVTRDRIYADASIRGEPGLRRVVVVDTGGFDPKSRDRIMQRVLDQTQLAIDEADVVVHVVDVRAGVLPEDREIASVLRRAEKRVVVAVNKVDGPKQEPAVAEFHQLGFPVVIPVSAEHAIYIADLQEAVVEQLPPGEVEDEGEEEEETAEEAEAAPPEEPAGPIRVAVIGRPNAGKSSLVNRLLGEDRHLVSEVPGTTRDAIDSLVERDGRQYLFIDTAGIRRKRSIALRLEKFSVVAALKGLERSDVALLLIDATQPVAEQDARVAGFAYERGRAVILVVSKWDAAQDDVRMKELLEKVRSDLPHLSYAPVVFTSAKTGYGLERLLPTIDEVHEGYGKRVTTGELNRFVEQVMKHHPPPSKKGRHGRIYYVRQIGVRPPRFLVSVNDPDLIHFSYRRYLVNEIRKRYGFAGVPLLIGYRGKKKRG